LAAAFFGAFDRAEVDPGLPFCPASRHAGGHEILDPHVEVSAHLVRHRVLEPVSVKQRVGERAKAIEHVTPRLE
jgi:hypothetical protein